MEKREKVQRLIEVAKLYYEKDWTQQEIAKQFGISRPMVSKLLKEAKKQGIVEIRILDPANPTNLATKTDNNQPILTPGQTLCQKYKLSNCILAKSDRGDQPTNQAIAEKAIQYLEELAQNGNLHFGIGWGHIIGGFVSQVEKNYPLLHLGKSICPLVGNGGVGMKNYHSNELVRVLSEHSEAIPEFIYAPAYMMSEQDLKLTKNLESYRDILSAWEQLDVALVNIGNFPSVPDFASKARYGDILTQERAVGRILNYFVSEDGYIIHSNTDYAIQIPLEILQKVPLVVGICSANTNPRALSAALRTGLIDSLIVSERVAVKTLSKK